MPIGPIRIRRSRSTAPRPPVAVRITEGCFAAGACRVPGDRVTVSAADGQLLIRDGRAVLESAAETGLERQRRLARRLPDSVRVVVAHADPSGRVYLPGDVRAGLGAADVAYLLARGWCDVVDDAKPAAARKR